MEGQPRRPFSCAECGQSFTRKADAKRHARTKHRGDFVTCRQCGETFSRQDVLDRHVSMMHRVIPPQPPNPAFRDVAGPSCAPAGPAYGAGHECDRCHKMFVTLFNLRRHQRRNCRGVRPPLDLDLPGPSGPPPPSPAPSTSSSSSESSGYAASSPPSPPTPAREEVDRGIPDDMAPEGFEEFETAFESRLKSYRLSEPCEETVSLQEFFVTVRERIITLMRRILKHVNAIKLNIFVECEFVNIHGETCHRNFKTPNKDAFQTTNCEDFIQSAIEKMLLEKENHEGNGSGLSFVRVLNMEVRVNVYDPLRGSSYIPTPHDIACRRAVINVLNDNDHRCFEYAILSKYLDAPEHVTPRHFTAEVRALANLNFDGLTFPLTLANISTFERNNPGVSVNVYGLDKKKQKKRRFNAPIEHIVYPLRVAKRELPNHFDLLFLTDDATTHYAWIKNFERLVGSQLTRGTARLFICKRCFAYFDDRPTKLGLRGAERLEEHKRYCGDHAPLRTDIPEEKHIQFKKFERKQRVRFTIYADFECALVPLEADQPLNPPSNIQPPAWDPAAARGATANQRPTGMDNARNVHVPYSYGYFIRDDHRPAAAGESNEDDVNDPHPHTFSKLRMYRGENAARHFINTLRDDVRNIGDMLYGQRIPGDPPQLTPQEENDFQQATQCYICEKAFTPLDVKVRDHQHSPPYRYRGAAHQQCNLQFKEQETIHVYLHNLSNYDAHFIVRELAVDKGNIDILANTEEKYITFSKRFKYRGAGRRGSLKVQFVDSYRLMSKGLANLASITLDDKLKITKARYPDDEEFQLLRRKGIFPYEYVTSQEVLEEDALPPKEVFGEGVTDDDYNHAQRVWEKFNCQTLGQYADVYLTTDVLLLADIFEGFRELCLKHYKLDPAYYLTLPSYAWDVMLHYTEVKLDTLQDVDMYLFFEKGIRGGLTQCVTRHVKANNKFTRMQQRNGASTSGYRLEERDDDTFLMYYDANNLYGWAMSEFLPQGEFEWLSPEEIEDLKARILDIPLYGQYGYVLEGDLHYPEDRDLHDKHRDLPFCPEVCKSPPFRLPYSYEDVISSGAGQSKKLMATLMDKKEYVVHYGYLQQALRNGLELTRIHRVLRFKQAAWLKPYVKLNTDLRARPTNSKFETEMFKLMVNAVYGMSLQNVRKHLNMKMAASRKIYTKYVAKANFLDRTWYNESLALLSMGKVRVVLNKPVYAGMCILDHSKRWMYGFHYDMVERYGLDNIRMCYMDTDGIIYSIRTRNVYEDMLDHLDEFDTSNYPENHRCYDPRNMRALGKFKDEAAGVTINEFVGLMAKLYCFTYGIPTVGDENGDEDAPPPVKKAKGVNRAVVKRDLTTQDYINCLYNKTSKSTDNQRFQSRHHILYTVVVNKRSLAPFDDKRYVMPEDGVNTLPWGHYAIPPRAPQLPAVPYLPPPVPAEAAAAEEEEDEPMDEAV